MERKDIKRPVFMQEAATGRGHMMLLEVLIAMLVFLVGSIAMGIIYIPAYFVYIFSDEEYMSMIMRRQQDMTKIIDMALNIPEWIMIVMLISEVFLIVVIILYCRFLEKRKLHTLGFRKKGMLTQYLLGLFFGALAFSAAFFICLATGSIKWGGISDNIVPLYIVGYFFGYMIQGMAEEVLCRGYLFVSLTKRYTVTTSITVSALFFAALHGMNNQISIMALINLFLFGVFAALLLLNCENIWIVGAFHSIWNFVQGNLYGIHVSGSRVQNSIFKSENVAGADFINGGGFGMEGGISVCVILVIGIAILVYRLNKKGAIINGNEQHTQFEQQINVYGNVNTGSGYNAGNENKNSGNNFNAGNGNTNAGNDFNIGNGNTTAGNDFNIGNGNTAAGNSFNIGNGNTNAGNDFNIGNGNTNARNDFNIGNGNATVSGIHNTGNVSEGDKYGADQQTQQHIKEENLRQTSFDKDYFRD